MFPTRRESATIQDLIVVPPEAVGELVRLYCIDIEEQQPSKQTLKVQRNHAHLHDKNTTRHLKRNNFAEIACLLLYSYLLLQ